MWSPMILPSCDVKEKIEKVQLAQMLDRRQECGEAGDCTAKSFCKRSDPEASIPPGSVRQMIVCEAKAAEHKNHTLLSQRTEDSESY